MSEKSKHTEELALTDAGSAEKSASDRGSGAADAANDRRGSRIATVCGTPRSALRKPCGSSPAATSRTRKSS